MDVSDKHSAFILKIGAVDIRPRFGRLDVRGARSARFHMLIINSRALRQGLGSARKHQNRERDIA